MVDRGSMNGVFIERYKIARGTAIKVSVGSEIIVGGWKPELVAGSRLPKNLAEHVFAFRLQQVPCNRDGQQDCERCAHSLLVDRPLARVDCCAW